MMIEICERVLFYRHKQLDAWIGGDKSITPDFAARPPIIINQPRYHFAEMFVLRHYYETEQWKGFASYALGQQYPRSERRADGRLKAAQIIPKDRLQRLQALRSSPEVARGGRGEPDLFLYKNTGQFKFVEVKKGSDCLREPQLICIAQILDVLQCEVDIVYVQEEQQKYTPKTYRFDIVHHTGERLV